MIQVRSYHKASVLSNGKVLVAGGIISTNTLKSAELYDPLTGIWIATAGNISNIRTEHIATLLTNGQVLLVGGSSLNGGLISQEMYNPTICC